MSLILEALKKSEARRQLGEAPGIGTPFSVAPRRRNALPLIVILILVAAGLGWWYLRTTPTPVGKSAAPDATIATPTQAPQNKPVATTPAPDSANAVPPVTAYPRPATAVPASPPNAATNVAPSQPIAAAPRPLNDRAPFGRNPRSEPGQRAGAPKPGITGVETPTAARPAFGRRYESVPAAPESGLAAAVSNADAAVADRPADAAPVAKPEPAANPVAPAAVPAPAPAQPGATRPAATAAPAAQTAPAAPNMTSYYNLPFEVRKDLPALTISMHVYAAVPAQRFIVIDGERKTEGETLKDGLTLREIRNDGAVFDFRGQVFFYPRPGR